MIRRAYLLAMALASSAIAQTPPPPPVAATAAPVPVEAFAALPQLERPKLSPDGTRIAAKQAIGGVQYLVVSSLFDAKASAALRIGDSVDVNWWRWVGNDWLAVGVGGTQQLYGEEYYITRTLGVSADMKKVNRLDWVRSGLRADDVIWTPRDGSTHILLAKQIGIETLAEIYPAVFDVDVATGRVRQVLAGQTNIWDWYADGAGVVRMGRKYSDENRRGALLYRASNGEPFKVIARSDKRKDEDFVVPLTFRADGTAIASDDSSGRDALYEVGLPDLKLGRKLYERDGYDIDGVIESRDGNDVAGVSVTDRYGHVVWFDPIMKEIQDSADKSTGDRRARIISWNADRTRFLVEVGSPSQAGALYYWNVGDGRMQLVSWQNAALKGRTLSPVTTVRYAARDGTMIEAVLTLPRGRTPKNLPLIVLPHGGPFARDSENWDWWTQYLAETGYAVIQPNYRGSSGYGRDFAKKGEGEWGLKMQDDLNDAITYLAKEGIADPKRVCMAGASYGGYAAMRAAQRDGALYRCAISYAGVSDLETMQRYDGRFLFGKTRGDWMKKQAPDYHAVSPRFFAGSFGIPILILHGKADKRVPVKQSRMMAAALKEAGKPYEYIEQPLGDHHFTRSEDRLAFLKAMGVFLAKYNPA